VCSSDLLFRGVGIPGTWDPARDAQSGGCHGRLAAVIVRGACRTDLSDAQSSFPPGRPEPARRRKRRRRRRAAPESPTVEAAPLNGILPPVIKVEIQNLDAIARPAPDTRAEDERLAARSAGLDDREAELQSAEAELAERRRSLEELEDRIGPTAALVESRESLGRREQRVGELERELRDRSRDVDQRENDLDARKAVLEADLELREEEVERREDLLAIREERLTERQRELGLYVSQIQGRIEPHSAAI